MMINLSRARVLVIKWLEENDPIEYLKKHGVQGNGNLDIYHIISMSTFDGEIYYRTCSRIDNDWRTIDIAGIYDGDDIDDNSLHDMSVDDYIELIDDHYAYFWHDINLLYERWYVDPDEILSTEKLAIMMTARNNNLKGGLGN